MAAFGFPRRGVTKKRGGTALSLVQGSLVLESTTVSMNVDEGANANLRRVGISNGGPGQLFGAHVGSVVEHAGSGWATAVIVGDFVEVTCDATAGSLVAGTYTATVSITDANASNSPQTIGVTLVVAPTAQVPVLNLSQSGVSFTGTAGGAATADQTVTVANAGGGQFAGLAVGAVEYGSGSGWASVSLSGATITLSCDPGALGAGTYTATVPVTASNASNSPQTLSLSFAVDVAAIPLISLSTNLVGFGDYVGGANPASQTITVTNVGGGNFAGLALGATTYGSGSGWLTTKSISNGVITLGVTTGALTAASYTASFPVTDANASNSPQTVSVTFSVAASDYAHLAPIYAALPTGLTFNPATGGYLGTVFDTAEPTWAATDSTLTDTGNATTNLSNLQSKINTLVSTLSQNTLVLLPALARYGGSLTLPSNTSGFWLGVETANRASLPTLSSGTVVGTTTNRVGLSDAADMPEFYHAATNANTIKALSGAARYYLRGLNFTNRNLLRTIGQVDIYSNRPDRIVFAQCLNDGGGFAADYVHTPYFLGGTNLAVIDSYAANIGAIGYDCQHVSILHGAGPYKVTNNYSEIGGGSENVMLGGSPFGSNAALLPSDVEIRGCHFEKPVGTNAQVGAHKNHVEVKWGRRILIEGNVTGYHNGGAQVGSILVKLANQDVISAVVDTSDVVIANNKITHTGQSSIALAGRSSTPGCTNVPSRIEAINNLIEENTHQNLTATIGTVASNSTFVLQSQGFRWNTVVSAAGSVSVYSAALQLLDGAKVTMNNVTISDNVLVSQGNSVTSVWGAGVGYGTTAITRYCTNATFTRNLVNVPSTDADYATQVRSGAKAISSIGFTNSAAYDYTLTPSSPGYTAGAGGQPCGCNHTVLNTILAGVV